MPKRILLIGGPSTGKTTLLNALAQKGYPCYREISREVIQKAQKEGIDQLFLEKPLLFSELLRDARIAQFEASGMHLDAYVFLDRGIPDTVAYMDYIKQEYPESFVEACQTYRYDEVFVLPLWEDIHTTDNERYENFEQSKTIQKELLETYIKYGYSPIEVPKDSVENRTLFILNTLSD